MSEHTYPQAAMLGDYLRAAAGFIPSAALLIAAPAGAVATGILAALAALFALFGIRTFFRHATRVEANEIGLTATGPLPRTIRWADLDRLKLTYYSTRRDRRDGWMQIELRGGGSTLRIDSRIVRFSQLVERAALAAAGRGVVLSAATAANLEALGIRTPILSGIADMAGGHA